MELSDAERRQASALIRQLRDPARTEDSDAALMSSLRAVLRHPGLADLLFWHDPDLSADEVIEAARQYRPIAL